MVGRKKIPRNVCIDTEQMICKCMGPIDAHPEEIEAMESVILAPDEVQALAYRDLDRLTMQQAADKMHISKTVFAGIYTSARAKQTDCLINGKILKVVCPEQEKLKKATLQD